MSERRKVLVTGASSGIGRATVLELARRGFAVVALVREENEREKLLLEVGGSGSIEVVVADLADPSARAGAVAGLELYGLVNNAGMMNAGLVRDVSLEAARSQLETTVLAPIDLIRRLLPPMLARGEGRVVNVTSSAVHSATPFIGWYRAEKAALRELTDSLRIELSGSGVAVIDVEPGGIATNIWRRAARELARRQGRSDSPADYERAIAIASRFRRVAADPDKVARVIGDELSRARPHAHRRVGLDATVLRLASELVPDSISDRLSRRAAGLKGNRRASADED